MGQRRLMIVYPTSKGERIVHKTIGIVALGLIALMLSGCSLHVKPQDGMTHVTFHVGAENYTLVHGEATLVDGQKLKVGSDVGEDIAKLGENALKAGGGLIGDVIKYVAGLFTIGK